MVCACACAATDAASARERPSLLLLLTSFSLPVSLVAPWVFSEGEGDSFLTSSSRKKQMFRVRDVAFGRCSLDPLFINRESSWNQRE